MATETLRNELYSKTWTASGNALNAVFLKDPAELTRDDAMTLICDNASTTVQWCQGFTNVCERAGLDIAGDWIAGWNTHHGLLPTRTPSDEMNQRVAIILARSTAAMIARRQGPGWAERSRARWERAAAATVSWE